MKNVDWTPGFSSRSLKSVVGHALPWKGLGESRQAFWSTIKTGYTSNPESLTPGEKKEKRMFRRSTQGQSG